MHSAPVPPRLWVIFLLLLANAFVFSSLLEAEFITYDDQGCLVKISYINQGLTWKGVQWVFQGHFLSGSKPDYWAPLTYLSHMVDFEIYRNHAGGHHLTNILLHTLNSVLLFFLFKRLTLSTTTSTLLALIWAVHPLNVQSVAWVIERKGLLSILFCFMTIHAYLSYIRSGKIIFLLASLTVYAFALMSKVTVVTLPVILLFLDFWPLGHLRWKGMSVTEIRKIFWEKVPFFILSRIS